MPPKRNYPQQEPEDFMQSFQNAEKLEQVIAEKVQFEMFKNMKPLNDSLTLISQNMTQMAGDMKSMTGVLAGDNLHGEGLVVKVNRMEQWTYKIFGGFAVAMFIWSIIWPIIEPKLK